MHWDDEGLLLRIQPHGESSLIATFLTKEHGLIKGYVRTNKKYPHQQGNIYHINRKARLASHLGLLTIEQHEKFSPVMYAVLQSMKKLGCLNAMRSLILACMMEHDFHHDDRFYLDTLDYLRLIAVDNAFGAYIHFECNLLSHCGFGLDLKQCAVTKSTENLTNVSPKTGRAVCEAVAAPYAGQLLQLPQPLLASPNADWSKEELSQGVRLTGVFMARMLQEHFHKPVPEERSFAVKLLLG